jgi:hypothetical protein
MVRSILHMIVGINGHNRRDDQNTHVSIGEAIPERQVFFKKEVPSLILRRIIFKYTLNILAIVIYSKTKTSFLSSIIKGYDFLTFLLKPILSYILFSDSTRSRFSKHKTYSHCSTHSPTCPLLINYILKTPRSPHRPSPRNTLKHLALRPLTYNQYKQVSAA